MLEGLAVLVRFVSQDISARHPHLFLEWSVALMAFEDVPNNYGFLCLVTFAKGNLLDSQFA
jgi:hypothetical protein